MNPRDIKLEFFDPQLDNKEDKPGRFRAVICASDASRTSGDIWKDENSRLVWFQQWGSGNLGWALCRRLEPDIGLGVWIEYNHTLQQYEVFEDDNIQRNLNSSRSSYLAPTEKDFLPAGRFQLWVNDKMIQPLAIYPGSTGLTISIVSGDYIYGGDRKTYAGTIDYDISASQPAGPSEHLYVGIYLDSNNTLQIINGATVSTGSTATEPVWPAGAFRLGVVDLDDSQTTITITDITNRKVVWTEDGGTSGLTSNVWPEADEVNISNVSYATWALAIDALIASDQAIIGEGTYDSDNERIDTASYVLGSGVDVSILETASSVSVLTIAKTLIYLENFTLQNTYGPSIYGDIYALHVTEDASLDAFRVKCLVTGISAEDNYGILIDSGGTHRIDNCIFDIENGTNNYALYIDTVEGLYSEAIVHLFDPDVIAGDIVINDGQLWIYGGYINGDVTAGDGATIYLGNLPLITGTVTEVGTGQVLGYYIDETGTIYPAIGGGVWPLAASTTNTDDGESYATIALLIAALAANEQGIIGEGTYTSNNQTITTASAVLGSGLDVSILTTSTTAQPLTITTNTVKLQELTLQNTYATSNCYALRVTSGAVQANRVKFEATGATANFNYGTNFTAAGSTHRLEDCIWNIQNGSGNFAIYMDDGDTADLISPEIQAGDISIANGTLILREPYITGDISSSGASSTVQIYGGFIDGDITQASSGTIELYNCPEITGTLTGTISGHYQDSNGKVRDASDSSLVYHLISNNNANDIYRGDNVSDSDFVATINGAPVGAAVVYNAPSSGDEANLVPTSTNQIAKMVLHNTTRGDDALISNCNTGTNTITLTAAAPGTWQNGDTITIRSQTNSYLNGSSYFVDFEFVSGIATDSDYFVAYGVAFDSGAVGQQIFIHPYEANSFSKWFEFRTQVTNLIIDATTPPVKLDATERRFCMGWQASGSGTLTFLLRLHGEGVTIG